MSYDQKIIDNRAPGTRGHIHSNVSTKESSAVVPERIKSFSHDSLGAKLFGDVVIGTGVTLTVAPFLTVVDKAIVQSAAGTQTLMRSMFESTQSMISRPGTYLKSPAFLLMWGVYAATYSTANSLKTLVEHKSYKDALKNDAAQASARRPTTSAEMGKIGIFLGTTFVNSSCSLVKDRAYAKLFGSSSAQMSVPRLSYAMWMLRDLSVVGSSFVLPDMVYPKLVEMYGMDESSARSFCQLALPVAAQFVAGPLHYIGLDMYNRNLNTKTWSEAIVDRSKALYKGVAPVVTARIARIAPGYGIGGVLNTKFRDRWRDYLVQREVKMMMAQPSKENASRLVALVHSKSNER